nr:hypothetical protein [uncultured Cupriavidus sp.]
MSSEHLDKSYPRPNSARAPISTDAISGLNAEEGADADSLLPLPVDAGGQPIDVAAADTADVVQSFFESYAKRQPNETEAEWLAKEFRKYPDVWESDAERESAARDVAASVERAFRSKADLQKAQAAGKSRASWLAGEISRIGAAQNINDMGAYAGRIETALGEATANSMAAVLRQDGKVSQCMNLDGFIAEQHHVDTFNIEATTKGSPYRAEVLKPKPGETFGKNSVDIVIRNGDGKIVKRYQSKYGADADSTGKLFDSGDYRGQTKLVPEGHGKDIHKSTETIEIGDIKSKPFSKEAAKEHQERAQKEGKSKSYDWETVDRGTFARKLLKDALIASLISVGFQGARILGRRAWNTLRGKRNLSASEDLQEFLSTSLSSFANTGVHTVFAGAMVIAVKRGLVGSVLKATPPGRIATAAFVALENIKILFKLGKGDINGEEALDAMGETTTVALVSLVAAGEGAAIGGAIGTVFGPVGTAIGGFAGGLVGGIAGGAAGQAIYAGAKKLGKQTVSFLSAAASTVAETAKNAVSSVAALFSW